MTEASCRKFRVLGRVQGVFYRASAQDTARKLRLTGWVRNCRNGDVELLACGSPAALDSLEAWLWKGPASARVNAVERTDAAREDVSGFEIRY